MATNPKISTSTIFQLKIHNIKRCPAIIRSKTYFEPLLWSKICHFSQSTWVQFQHSSGETNLYKKLGESEKCKKTLSFWPKRRNSLVGCIASQQKFVDIIHWYLQVVMATHSCRFKSTVRWIEIVVLFLDRLENLSWKSVLRIDQCHVREI